MNDSKKQILLTATKLFLKNPYKEVSLRDIVNEVGLTKGAFYHYYTSKEQLFEEAVKYFYNHILISNYSNFPKTSLKEFYESYLVEIQEPNEFDDMENDTNLFIFLSEASKKMPNFKEIHTAQRKKELWAWAEIIETAKYNKEIKTHISNEDLAMLFLNISDGALLNMTLDQYDGGDSLKDIKRDWDNLYDLIMVHKK
jgi:AcrR family transcriptional regulator